MTVIRAIRADTYDGGRWLRLAATTVHQTVSRSHRRTVSPVLPADLTELWVGVEQCRHRIIQTLEWGEWGPACGVRSQWNLMADNHQTRLALVYRCSGVTELPVVEGDPRSFEYPCLVLEQWGTFYLNDGEGNHEHLGNREADQPDYEPWAADLAPGEVVLDLGTVEAIDPITEMVCPVDTGYSDTDDGHVTNIGWCQNCGGSGTVPLVLPSDRITEIEVP